MSFSARNSSWPLAIFRPISTFDRPKSILVGQIYCTLSMGQQSITYKMFDFQENGRPIFDPYFYHCPWGVNYYGNSQNFMTNINDHNAITY